MITQTMMHHALRGLVTELHPEFKGSVQTRSLMNDEMSFMLYDEGGACLKVTTQVIPHNVKSLSLNEFTERRLMPVVAQWFPEPAVPKFADDSFADEPLSIGELRSQREDDGSKRSVRDMLVEVLRKIDSGDPDFQDLSVGVLIMRRRLSGELTDTCSWRAGGPAYDTVQMLGLLTYAQINLVGGS